MAKKQTRRSISVSRMTYERLKAFCEANHVSMSQLVETRVNDFLGLEGHVEVSRPVAAIEASAPAPAPALVPARPVAASPYPIHAAALAPPRPAPPAAARPLESRPVAAPAPAVPAPLTSVAARIAIEPPPPIIKPRQETAAPKPVEKRPEQIFTF
jgi:hypothetical protein